jgi:hypothetical protein
MMGASVVFCGNGKPRRSFPFSYPASIETDEREFLASSCGVLNALLENRAMRFHQRETSLKQPRRMRGNVGRCYVGYYFDEFTKQRLDKVPGLGSA